MPTYDYFCEACQHSMEAFQKITDKHLEECPECKKSTLKRKPGGGIGLSFSGSGFYINDYSKLPANNGAPTDSGPCCPCGKKSASACENSSS
jgi:putative FmdB family regulatory protein